LGVDEVCGEQWQLVIAIHDARRWFNANFWVTHKGMVTTILVMLGLV
jgi:hypothetical protein